MKEKKLIIRTLFIITLILIAWVFTEKGVKASTMHSQTEAINWATNKGDTNWNVDVDGSYGCQCVDLILAYYDYLVGYHVSGNATDYTWNQLPEGWTRVTGTPRAGDIAVWKPGAAMGWSPLITSYADSTYGHVGIVWKVNDWGTIGTIETRGKADTYHAAYYERYPNNVACFIRPNFQSFPLTQTLNIGDNFYAYLKSDNMLYNADRNSNIVLENYSFDKSLVWNFIRQNDGTYLIKNVKTGLYLDVYCSNDYDGGIIRTFSHNGSSAQRYYIYEYNNRYIIRPQCSETRVVTVNNGGNSIGNKLNMWFYYFAAETQRFDIQKINTVKASSLKYNKNGQKVTLSWTKGENAENYKIFIRYKKSGEYAPYNTVINYTKTSYSVNLPAGEYEVYIEGQNLISEKASNTIRFTISNNAIFTDVKTTDWFYTDLKYCYDKGIITGTDKNTFDPNAKFTKAMLVTILWRMEGKPKAKYTTNFVDCPKGYWCYDAAQWSISSGVAYKLDATHFNPNKVLERNQFIECLRNYARLKGKNTSARADLTKFKDYNKQPEYSKASMSWAVAKGIMVGGNNGTMLYPLNTTTKAEAVAFIARYCRIIGL